MKFLIIYLFLIKVFSFHVLKNSQSIELLIDPDFTGVINLYDKPNGKVIKSLREDFKNEDYLLFTSTDENSDFFYGTIEYAISGRQAKGWIKKAKYIGVYTRNYSLDTPLKLFIEPNIKARIKLIIPGGKYKFCQVFSFKDKWVYVHFEYKGKVHQGWISPEMQCTNAYTTCN